MEILELMRGFKKGELISYINYENGKTVEYFAAFLAAGLERNEKCIYHIYDTSQDDIKESLMKYNMDVTSYLASGQLIFIPLSDFYLKSSHFAEDFMTSKWFNTTARKQSTGSYTGMRVIMETGWIDDNNLFQRVLEYAEYLRQTAAGSDLTVLYQYRVDKCSSEMIKKILQIHDYVFCDNGHSVSLFKSQELLRSENTITFLHESFRDRAKLNQTCRHLAFINNLTAQTIYQQGPQYTIEKALAYLAREYMADAALSIIMDKETKRALFISCYGLDPDLVVSMVAGPVLKQLYDYAGLVIPYITERTQTSILNELWAQKEVNYLGVIPMQNGCSVAGIAFFGWNKASEAYTADLDLFNYFLNTVNMTLDVHYVQEKTFQKKKDIEKLEALGTLTSGIAHEFNNILAVILGNCQLLQLKSCNSELAKYVSEVATAAKDAANIVRRIQNYSQPNVTYERRNLQVNSIITSALEFTRTKWINEAVAAGIKISIETKLNSVKQVWANESELREVLVNLILNAVDAMPEGGKITIASEDIDDKVVITITDTGIGMTEEEAKRAFDPFFTTKFERGTGLGLTISKNIITAHNGEISVESEKGRGTVFTIILPEGNFSEPEREQNDRKPGKSLNIIVVDDDEQVLGSVSNQLTALGHRVTGYTNAADLLSEIDDHGNFDLIITDLAMPGINGLSLAKKIKESNKQLPVILMTGWFDEFRSFPDKEKFAGILYKPFTLYDLQKQIEEVKLNVS